MGEAARDSESLQEELLVEQVSASQLDISAPRVKGATVFQGTVALVNILLGVGLLSAPYAMAMSGTAGIVAVALCCLLFCTSGHFIAWSLDMLPPDAPSGYCSLGEAALGRLGKHLVTVAAAAELFGGSCMMMIILWKSIEMLLPPAVLSVLPPGSTLSSTAILLGTALEAPLCLFGTYPTLTPFSAAGCASTVVVMVLVVALPLLDPDKQWLEEAPAHHTLSRGILPASGILALSVALHSTFPSVRGSMADRSAFPRVIDYTFLVCFVIVGSVAGVGYWYWGDAAHVLVIQDFDQHSPYRAYRWGGVGIEKVVDAMVGTNMLTTIPLTLLALVDIVRSSAAAGGARAAAGGAHGSGVPAVREGPFATLGLRLLVVSAIVCFSYATRNVLGSVEAVIGGVCNITSSLLLPTLFFAALQRRKGGMTAPLWAAAVAMGAVGVGLMSVVVLETIRKFAGHGTGGKKGGWMAMWEVWS